MIFFWYFTTMCTNPFLHLRCWKSLDRLPQLASFLCETSRANHESFYGLILEYFLIAWTMLDPKESNLTSHRAHLLWSERSNERPQKRMFCPSEDCVHCCEVDLQPTFTFFRLQFSISYQPRLRYFWVITLTYAAISQTTHPIIWPKRAITIQVDLEVSEERCGCQFWKNGKEMFSIYKLYWCKVTVCMK